jgi:hypothetical protein
VLISIGNIPLWVALAAEADIWGLLMWRMVVMLPQNYLIQTIIGCTATVFVFNLRDRVNHFGAKSAAFQIVALYGAFW